MDQNESVEISPLYRPVIGTSFAVSAGLLFFLLCMMLPLVGPTGCREPHYGQNQAAFLLVWFLTFLCSGVSVYSQLGLRKLTGSAKPFLSMGLCVICILTLVVFLLGGFKI